MALRGNFLFGLRTWSKCQKTRQDKKLFAWRVRVFCQWRYDVSHKKPATPNQKIFFRVQSRRLADLFEPLNNSPAQSAEELGHWQGNWKLLFFRPKSKYEYIIGRLSKCLDPNKPRGDKPYTEINPFTQEKYISCASKSLDITEKVLHWYTSISCQSTTTPSNIITLQSQNFNWSCKSMSIAVVIA